MKESLSNTHDLDRTSEENGDVGNKEGPSTFKIDERDDEANPPTWHIKREEKKEGDDPWKGATNGDPNRRGNKPLSHPFKW